MMEGDMSVDTGLPPSEWQLCIHASSLHPQVMFSREWFTILQASDFFLDTVTKRLREAYLKDFVLGSSSCENALA